MVEIAGTRTVPAYDYLIAVVFSLLTLMMIGACGWIVFLWDIDRLFFSLERKIDTQTVSDAGADGSLLGRVRDMLSSKVQHLRAEAVRSIEKAYWEDINAGGVLAFPQPDIARAIEHIDEGRRDLLAPLTELVARTVPVGSSPAALVSRVLFRYLAPEVKLRLYRRLILRFLAQLSALFVLAALCFYFSILGWSRVSASVFTQPAVSATSVLLVSARSHAARRALRFHGAYAPLSVADLHQSASDGVRVLHAGLPHVRGRVLHLISLQSGALRRAALEGSVTVRE